jgi:DNA-binding transcriptional regulator YhcF (GntR family)
MIALDDESSVPPYDQIRTQYATLISQGELAAGARLPTVRQLASDLQLAVNTVARAYRELEAAGLVETRGRAGTVVSAQGDRAIAAAVDAARAYAARAFSLGISPDDALEIVQAALSS